MKQLKIIFRDFCNNYICFFWDASSNKLSHSKKCLDWFHELDRARRSRAKLLMFLRVWVMEIVIAPPLDTGGGGHDDSAFLFTSAWVYTGCSCFLPCIKSGWYIKIFIKPDQTNKIRNSDLHFNFLTVYFDKLLFNVSLVVKAESLTGWGTTEETSQEQQESPPNINYRGLQTFLTHLNTAFHMDNISL